MHLKDNVTIVIGGTGVIGRTVCQKFAEAGATVMIGFHQDEIRAIETLKLVENVGANGNLFQLDVAKPEEMNQLVQDACDRYHRIDTVIYAIGGPLGLEDFLELKAETWQKNLNLTLTGFYNCAKAILPQMRQQNYGRIMALGGAGANLLNAAKYFAWDTAKTALIKLVKSLAVEEIRRGITLNVVNPSLVLPSIYFSAEEEMLIEAAFPKDIRERMRETIPAQRFATAEEVADVLLFLAGDSAGYLTGNAIDVTGGLGV